MPYLSDYKALLFDVDGTLATHDGYVSPELKLALHELQKQNYVCGVCTGRGFLSLEPYLKELFKPAALHVIMGGGQLINSLGAVQYEEKFLPETAKAVFAIGKKYNTELVFKTIDTYYCTPEIIHGYARERAYVKTAPIETLPAWHVNMITMYHLKPGIGEELQKIPGITVKPMLRKNGDAFYDITPGNITKLHCLEKWSEQTGIPFNQIIGFGDSENDIEFLSAVGYSVAMGNALDSIKSIADKTIGHIAEDGLGTYLESILKGNEL